MKKTLLLSFLIVCIALLTACNGDAATIPTDPTSNPESPDAPTEAPAEPTTTTSPTATPIPPAAWVNGEGLPEFLYQSQIAMLMAVEPAFGAPPTAEEAKEMALDSLIKTMLLAQGARENGFQLTNEVLDQRLQALAEESGGQDALNLWLAKYQYTEESFRMQLSLEIEAEAMRRIIFDNVPTIQEHLEAHDFLFPDAYSAERILDQFVNGAAFETVQANNDPYNDGYMGWFPRGFLLDAAIEDAAFTVEAPGYYGAVVENETGYHVIYVLFRDMEHEVSPNALLELKEQALIDWLEQKTAQSSIEILLP